MIRVLRLRINSLQMSPQDFDSAAQELSIKTPIVFHKVKTSK
jgi:hypothetical protein